LKNVANVSHTLTHMFGLQLQQSETRKQYFVRYWIWRRWRII